MELEKHLETIVHRCQDGERAAFEELFELYQPRLKYYVRRLDCDGINVDDILQDIWLTVVKEIRKLKESKVFAVWLYRIARNKVYDGFRRREEFAALPEESELSVSQDETTFDAKDAEKLHTALKILKPYHREVLTLCFIEQMSYQSIAEVIGCGIGTVRSRIFYAKQALRKELERQNG
ncbi:MAG: ECF RNA polymerase sigma factor SigE [Planctomycetes bacterium ADurb.Bin401]|nr:MAG: ECF RNA polymerase sigma factor SigE [Planctomycetes bacterium ADurb.Bin401]